jgi:hypothetical protein
MLLQAGFRRDFQESFRWPCEACRTKSVPQLIDYVVGGESGASSETPEARII